MRRVRVYSIRDEMGKTGTRATECNGPKELSQQKFASWSEQVLGTETFGKDCQHTGVAFATPSFLT